MAGRFITKRQQSFAPQKRPYSQSAATARTTNGATEDNNKKTTEDNMLTTAEKVDAFATAMNGQPQKNIKKVKSDKGLIEKVESTKTVLTEDNRELLRD